MASDNCDWEAEDLRRGPAGAHRPGRLHRGLPVPGAAGSVDRRRRRGPGLGDRPGGSSTMSRRSRPSCGCAPAGYNFDIELEYEDGVDFQGRPEAAEHRAGRGRAGELGSPRRVPSAGRVRSSARRLGSTGRRPPTPAARTRSKMTSAIWTTWAATSPAGPIASQPAPNASGRCGEHEDQARRRDAERGGAVFFAFARTAAAELVDSTAKNANRGMSADQPSDGSSREAGGRGHDQRDREAEREQRRGTGAAQPGRGRASRPGRTDRSGQHPAERVGQRVEDAGLGVGRADGDQDEPERDRPAAASSGRPR